MRLALYLLPLVGLATLFSAPAKASDSFTITEATTYTVVVYAAGASAGPAVADALEARPAPEGAEASLLLQSRDAGTVVEVIAWQDPTAAPSFRAPYFPAAQAYWRREFTPVASVAKEGEGLAITASSHVQWSEFLLRDPGELDDLSAMVGGMVEGMTLAGPDELRTMSQLHATSGAQHRSSGHLGDPGRVPCVRRARCFWR